MSLSQLGLVLLNASTLQRAAMERATQLLVEIVGGEAGPVVEVVEDRDLPSRPDVTLRAARIEKVLGFDMAAAEVERPTGKGGNW